MNPDTEVFMGVVATIDEPSALNIARWKFDGSFDDAKTGRLWIDDEGTEILPGSQYLLTGGFKRWCVLVVESEGVGCSAGGLGEWLFEVVEEIW